MQTQDMSYSHTLETCIAQGQTPLNAGQLKALMRLISPRVSPHSQVVSQAHFDAALKFVAPIHDEAARIITRQLPGALWAALLAGLAVAGLAATLRAAFSRNTSPATAQVNDRLPLNLWIACVRPGWLALVGVGCLVALDFGARSPVVAGYPWGDIKQAGARYFGLHQLDAFWLSSGLLLTVVALRAHFCAFFCTSALMAEVAVTSRRSATRLRMGKNETLSGW